MSPELKSAGLGVLVVVVGWIGWSMLHPDEPSAAEPAHAPPSPVAAALPPAPEARRIALVPTTSALPPASAAIAAPRTLAPVLKDGFVLEHGQVTAVRSPVGDSRDPPGPPTNVALPPGVRSEDATVSPTGVVTVLRSPPATAGAPVDNATADALRPQALMRSN